MDPIERAISILLNEEVDLNDPEVKEYYDQMTTEQMVADLKKVLSKLKGRVNEWSVRDTLMRLTEWGFYRGDAMASIDMDMARDIIKQTLGYVDDIAHNKNNLIELYDFLLEEGQFSRLLYQD